MNEMVERVARALLEGREKRLAFKIDSKPARWEDVPHWHNDLKDDARDAIAAHEAALIEAGFVIVPREPTKAMLIAAMRPGDGLLPGREKQHEINADTWRAMIDSALAE